MKTFSFDEVKRLISVPGHPAPDDYLVYKHMMVLNEGEAYVKFDQMITNTIMAKHKKEKRNVH